MLGLKNDDVWECRMPSWTYGIARWAPKFVAKNENGLVVPY